MNTSCFTIVLFPVRSCELISTRLLQRLLTGLAGTEQQQLEMELIFVLLFVQQHYKRAGAVRATEIVSLDKSIAYHQTPRTWRTPRWRTSMSKHPFPRPLQFRVGACS